MTYSNYFFKYLLKGSIVLLFILKELINYRKYKLFISHYVNLIGTFKLIIVQHTPTNVYKDIHCRYTHVRACVCVCLWETIHQKKTTDIYIRIYVYELWIMFTTCSSPGGIFFFYFHMVSFVFYLEKKICMMIRTRAIFKKNMDLSKNAWHNWVHNMTWHKWFLMTISPRGILNGHIYVVSITLFFVSYCQHEGPICSISKIISFYTLYFKNKSPDIETWRTFLFRVNII